MRNLDYMEIQLVHGAGAGDVVICGAVAASAVAGWVIGTAVYDTFAEEIQAGLDSIFG